MKDHKLVVPFSKGEFTIWHKSLFGDIEQFFTIINNYRASTGRAYVYHQAWLRTQAAKEYREFFKAKYGVDPVRVGRGRARTTAHIKYLIRAAIDLSPEFADEVIDLFIEKRLPQLRDEGGDLYLELRDALTTYGEAVLGKPAHKGHVITLNRVIKRRSGLDPEKSWDQALPEHHAMRMRMEDALVTMLKAGVVRDWDHLKELAEIV